MQAKLCVCVKGHTKQQRLREIVLASVNRQTPVNASHSLMVLSLEPEIRKGPGVGPPFLF